MAEKLTNTPNTIGPAEFLEIYQEIRVAQREIDAATGRKRAIHKRLKSAGGDLDALALLQKLAKLEPEDAEMRLRSLTRYAGWLKLPIGAMLDMFGKSDDAPVPAEAANQHDEFSADDAGYKAGRAAESIDANPHDAGTARHAAWARGWHQGQASLAPAQSAEEDDAPAAPKPSMQRGRRTAGRRRGAEERAAR